MVTLIISERQPILRLGLRLAIQAHYHSICLREISDIDELSMQSSLEQESAIILGLDTGHSRIDPNNLRSIKEKFPESKLIIYADIIKNAEVLSYFTYGIAAYVSKRATEMELVKCLRSVMENKKYVSSKNKHVVLNDFFSHVSAKEGFSDKQIYIESIIMNY